METSETQTQEEVTQELTQPFTQEALCSSSSPSLRPTKRAVNGDDSPRPSKRARRLDDGVTAVEDIAAWPTYAAAHKLDSKVAPSPGELSYDYAPELNEKIALWSGDMTKLAVDAIVNAANRTLLGGGGIDGAIHRAAGSKLRRTCSLLGGCEVGDAKITPGFNLPAAHVIHTVGPIGRKPKLLSRCYTSVLDLAKAEGLRSVCFCCISTGIYGFPNELAALVAPATVREWLEASPLNAAAFDRIVFCTFLPTDTALYEASLRRIFPLAPPPAPVAGQALRRDSTILIESLAVGDSDSGTVSDSDSDSDSATESAEPEPEPDLVPQPQAQPLPVQSTAKRNSATITSFFAPQ
ncbi:MACRO domain-containing protein 1 [Thecamonas trahens ATCC 50062]|uniref:MACRO domain-containing protein 1 n=1 Tax=Thecamonas trahens ATCC 50062 TaxID=461836 RepID=A0A0L0DUM2_THETB|nr:MACRO domain-containing protein 1 [Thecamonas trahens ATCC 50062]KNC55902.1 MACRO domain-containing protein 1 [Thecamonas trahens ATCC 50062]|eukprot:XP_013752721.1 MACRO domain-containing protein 1 [Thecamonas trahens ATCC 50062]